MKLLHFQRTKFLSDGGVLALVLVLFTLLRRCRFSTLPHELHSYIRLVGAFIRVSEAVESTSSLRSRNFVHRDSLLF